MAINPYLIASIPYHPLRALTPISLLGYANNVAYVRDKYDGWGSVLPSSDIKPD
jgi:hypothetical protein